MKKYILTITLFFCLMLGVLGFYFTKDQTISETERRKLYPYPKLSLNDLQSGETMSQLEKALQDHFIFRDSLKNIQYHFYSKVMGQKVYNERFIENDVIASLFYTDQGEQFKKSALYYEKLNEAYFQDAAAHYYSFIPNKDYYLETDLPRFDMDTLADYQVIMNGFSREITLHNQLDRDDFYKSDLHWKHENLDRLSLMILEEMSHSVTLKEVESHVAGHFIGSDARAIASLNFDDQLIYQSWPALESYHLIDLVSAKNLEIYDLNAMDSLDPYALFLAGPQAIISLEKDNFDVEKDETLYLVRDSYASSIAPYFTLGYKRIILIDMRYIDAKLLGRFIEVNSQDTVYYLNALLMLSKPELLR